MLVASSAASRNAVAWLRWVPGWLGLTPQPFHFSGVMTLLAVGIVIRS